MSEKRDTFDELVKSLAVSERREMLDRLAELSEVDTTASETEGGAESAQKALVGPDENKIRFSEASFFVRFWFKLLSFFSSSTPEEKYNAHLVAELGRKLNQKYGAYFSLPKRMYTDLLYQDLVFLENIRSYFLPFVNEYDKHRGDFYILLSSLIAPESAATISMSLDPSSEPYDNDSPKDLHSAYLKKMDETFSTFSPEEKAKIYQAAQAAEWLSSFEGLSLNRTILQFADTTGTGQMCPIDTVVDDFKKLSSILASAVKIPTRLIETLFIFSQKDKMEDESFSFDRECTEFVRVSVNNLTGIASFRSRVPIADFVRFSSADIVWEPVSTRAGEDWFMLFKASWKERFERRFEEWAKLRDKHALKKRALTFLEARELPTLEYTPWADSWVPFNFHRETVLLFLKAFFSGVYLRRISKVLRIILAEGDFYKRENLSEFTDDFNILEHAKADIDDFERRLAPKGDIGEGFELALTEKKGTHSGKARLDHLMSTVESEAESLCTRQVAAMRSMHLILGGILNVSRGGQYDTLANLSSLQGSENGSFRPEISSARFALEECVGIIEELSKQ